MGLLPFLTVVTFLLGPPFPPLLVVVAPTGETREGLPVFRLHPEASSYEAVLARGFSGRLLRLFRQEQQYLARRDGTPVEPAYLLLSDTQGGFPRFGFWLGGERKATVGYVDLHRRQPLSGRFGAMDQIFPHELLHVIVRQLAGPPPPAAGGANQVHAIGIRTDRITAFDEGFAEHGQVLAVDDADATAETRALATDASLSSFAADRLARYQRALTSRIALAPPARLGFVLWFSQTEQVLRYHAVKSNAFAHEPVIPPRLLDEDDPFPAYLLENVLPGPAEAAFKATPRLLATEGAVASLFSRWVVDPSLQQPAVDPTLYDRFGVASGDLTAIEHAYLKLFAVLGDRRPHDTAALVRAYVETFPGEAEAVARLVSGIGLAWPLPDVPEIWLANDRFKTGTTIFDQYRAAPRTHTFDLNAASVVDLLSVDGVSPELAAAIRHGAPYAAIEEVGRVPGVTQDIVAELRGMRSAMAAVRQANERDDAESIDLIRIFAPVIWRVMFFIALASVAAAWLYGRARRLRLARRAANGLAASVVGLLSAWIFGAALQVHGHGADPALLSFLPVALFGLPGTLWQIARRGPPAEAARVAAAWAIACVPAVLITTPWF